MVSAHSGCSRMIRAKSDMSLTEVTVEIITQKSICSKVHMIDIRRLGLILGTARSNLLRAPQLLNGPAHFHI